MVSPEKFFSLIGGIIIGYFMAFVPSPIDIGEMILLQIAGLNLCKTDICIEQQETLLNYYNIGGLIIGIASSVEMFRSFRNN